MIHTYHRKNAAEFVDSPTRPRVGHDPEGAGPYRVLNGRLQIYGDLRGWRDVAHLFDYDGDRPHITAARVALWSDLFTNPVEPNTPLWTSEAHATA